MNGNRRGFTLIELLVVIAIIAVLAVVVVLVLNPAGLLQESRDANRLSDMATLKSAIGYYQADNATQLGNANTAYVSIPDTSPTCANLGLPTLPAGWSYACAPGASSTLTNGNGWLPVNFNSVPLGSPLAKLPSDPLNVSSTRDYYIYTTSGSSWKVSTELESVKNISLGPNDGGTDPLRYEVASNMSLPAGGGLIGWYAADALNSLSDGNAVSSWSDSSGGGAVVTQATPSLQPIYKINILNGKPVVRFDGVGTFLQGNIGTSSAPVSLSFVAKDSGTTAVIGGIVEGNGFWGTYSGGGGNYVVDGSGGSTANSAYTASSISSFRLITSVYTTSSTYNDFIYLNGSLERNATPAGGGASTATSTQLQLGGRTFGGAPTWIFKGDIAEALAYDFSFTPIERQMVEKYLNGKYNIY